MLWYQLRTDGLAGMGWACRWCLQTSWAVSHLLLAAAEGLKAGNPCPWLCAQLGGAVERWQIPVGGWLWGPAFLHLWARSWVLGLAWPRVEHRHLCTRCRGCSDWAKVTKKQQQNRSCQEDASGILAGGQAGGSGEPAIKSQLRPWVSI